jgi:two-component system sensor histidine kinase YesM
MKRLFFIKRFSSYFLTTLIPTIIIFGIVFYIMLGNTKAGIKADTNKSLLIANNNLDLIISNVAYQNDLMTTSPEYALSLNALLNESEIEYNYLIFLKSIRTVLSSMVESRKYVASIYLYMDGARKFFSSSTGVEALDSYYDISWYDTVKSFKDTEEPIENWVEKRIVKKGYFAEGKEYITLYQRMKYVDGIIVINIDPERFKEILNTIFSDDSTSVFIVNNKNEVLAANSIGEKKRGEFQKYLINKRSDKSLEESWTAISGGKNLICSTEYKDYDLTLYSVVSEKALWEQLNSIIWILLIVFFVNCLVVLVIAYVVTMRNFHQISYVVDTFDKAERGIYPEVTANNKANDEYEVILNNILRMFINTTYLNSQLEQKQYKQKIAELTALQTQINPHFLFNTLQTLNFELMKVKNSDVSSLSIIIQELSEILKYALKPSIEMVSLRQEIVYLKKYIDIQKYRFDGTLVVYYQIDDHILDYPVSRLILQPIIENSIIHGIRYSKKKGYIKLKVRQKEDYILFSALDNGIGMETQEVEELYKSINDGNSFSIGLANVNYRLKLNYGESYGINIRSKKGLGTCVSFKIPYVLDYVKKE